MLCSFRPGLAHPCPCSPLWHGNYQPPLLETSLHCLPGTAFHGDSALLPLPFLLGNRRGKVDVRSLQGRGRPRCRKLQGLSVDRQIWKDGLKCNRQMDRAGRVSGRRGWGQREDLLPSPGRIFPPIHSSFFSTAPYPSQIHIT